MPSPDGPLACPRCGRRYEIDARLCADCSMPLVHAEGREQAAHGLAHEEARKIHPRMARGALRRVTVAGNLAEAELIKGVLLEQGIPSLIRRTAGFDVPDFLAAGPRDILVPDAAFAQASGLLAEIDADHAEAESGRRRIGAGARAASPLVAPGRAAAGGRHPRGAARLRRACRPALRAPALSGSRARSAALRAALDER